MFERWYQKIYEAGYNARAIEEQESHSKNLESMFERGKQIGRHDGYLDGYADGYKNGYIEGEMDGRSEVGAISLEGLPDVEEFKGFHGLVNDRGFVDDVNEAMEATV